MRVPLQLVNIARELLENKYRPKMGLLIENEFRGHPRKIVAYLKKQAPVLWMFDLYGKKGKPLLIRVEERLR